MDGSAKLRDPEGASPAMAQWFAAKAAHPHALLFFRMGDFYELFFDDAEAAAGVLGLALTTRGEHAGEKIPLCGVPAHAAEGYLLRLIRRGFRVAIVEQMEEARNRAGKAPIRREVVRLVTPGTLTEDALLEAGRPNRLLALARQGDALGAAWVDLSAGVFETQALALADLPALLGRLDPAEILAPDGLALGEWQARRAPPPAFSAPLAARRRVADFAGVASLDALGVFADVEVVAAAACLDYAAAAAAGRLPVLAPPRPLGATGRLELDVATRASLEIARARDGGTAHTLLTATRRTLTAPGGRLLADHLASPLLDIAAIGDRQDAWSWLLANPARLAALRAALRGAPDMARALARLSLGRGGPRDLAAMRDGLDAAARASAALDDTAPPLLAESRVALLVPDLAAELGRALADPAPARLDQGAIAAGYDAELDAERGLRDDSRRVIAALQLDLAQRSGVASLKIRHHAQLGYVIEVPASAAETLRAQGYVLRQGMASAARFSSDEVSDLDRRISEAAERAAARERVVFQHLCARVLAAAGAIADAAAALAVLDVAQSAAALAEGGRWCRPVVTDDGAFELRALRHPVVEAALAAEPGGGARFVPNDCDLSPGRQVLLLTGPNMAGKSTFLRQNALAVLLAQAGLPVPAASARIGVADRLFSRVGASDDLARARSTFMVEMTETAAILHQAGPRSLVVVDEIGRGTATLDGLAIAWAVLEALHNTVRCRTIFATHFHELAQLGGELPRLRPHAMRVREWQGDVVFLHEIAEGAAGRSWGVHVARLAGVPAPVVRRAARVLAALEARAGRLTDAAALPLFAAAQPPEPAEPPPPTEAPGPAERLREAVAALRPDELSPREALAAIYHLRALIAVTDAPGMLPSR
jgi:DNA mismatch repair protein MutS